MSAFSEAGQTSSIFQKCARFLLLNSPKDLLDLQQMLTTIVSNILENSSEPKFRYIKLSNKLVQSKIAKRKGGFEFLNGLGFEVVMRDGDKTLFLPASSGSSVEESVLSEATRRHLQQSMQWFNENVQICLEYSRIQQAPSSSAAYSAALAERPCAECVIQIKLPLAAGVSIAGGFGRTEKLSDVVAFAKCFFTDEKAASLLLRLAQDASALDITADLTLIEAGLFPRALLIATTQSDEDRTTALKTAQKVVSTSIKQQADNSEKLRKEKLALGEARKKEKEKVLQAFKEDREK